jgi:hypothetical protein
LFGFIASLPSDNAREGIAVRDGALNEGALVHRVVLGRRAPRPVGGRRLCVRVATTTTTTRKPRVQISQEQITRGCENQQQAIEKRNFPHVAKERAEQISLLLDPNFDDMSFVLGEK